MTWSRSRTGGGPPSAESALEKTRDTENVEAARRRREDRRVIPVGAPLEKAPVHRVNEHVLVATAPVRRTIVYAIRSETESREERGNAVRPREGSGEEEQHTM
eukprot:3921815-Pleurochrysis_carterae.AAC.7